MKISKSAMKKTTILMLAINFMLVGMLFLSQKVYANGINYYYSDFESKADVYEAGVQLNEEINGEGITLLKNTDNALPIDEGAKISVFSRSSVDMLYSGAGSGSGSGSGRIDLYSALNSSGFKTNNTLKSFYENSSERRGTASYTISAGLKTGELPVSQYSQAIVDSYAGYNDAALVVITRIGGESLDLPRSMASGFTSQTGVFSGTISGARSNTDHFLQLDKNETDLLQHVSTHFDKVIVIFNMGSQFETGFLDDENHYAYQENIKAALWIGFPGNTGLTALAKVLKGEINPSGKTVDTYARDFKKDPTWNNFANNLKSNGNKYTNATLSQGQSFVEYEEGIYVGYRYYETRGFTTGNASYTGTVNGTTTNQWNNWYEANVVYPFGYGLSYTTFDWEIVEWSSFSNNEIGATDTIKVKVKVKNTGTVAGKDVVQLYYTAPYYNNGVEKAHVVLGAFEKTELIEPGLSQVVEISMKVRDMASYDWNDANNNLHKGYELDSGNYDIKVMKDAHTVVDVETYNVAADIFYDFDSETNTSIENLFDNESDYIEGRDGYLSRADWEGTWPTMPTGSRLVAEQAVLDEVNIGHSDGTVKDIVDSGKPWYVDDANKPNVGINNGIMLKDLIGLNFDNPLWDSYLDQFTVSEMIDLVSLGAFQTAGISRLGLPMTVNTDGPSGWGNRHVQGNEVSYSSETVLASTWNKELSYKKGLLLGNEALFGNENSGLNYPGLYAPAVNIHRSAFSGRNFEYYSEDGYLSGILAAEVVKGAAQKGVFTYVKHFAINDQESDRNSLITWASEQSMREIYLRAFEITVKEGKTRGIMTGLNRVGGTWSGSHYNLLTKLLREEWGFKGIVVSDYINSDRIKYANYDYSIRTGGDLMLNNVSTKVDYDINSATTIASLRRATKNITYVVANSMAMNENPAVIMSKYQGKILDLAKIDKAYSADLATVTVNDGGNNNEVVYKLKAGSSLPEGLVIDSAGKVTGTPTQEVKNHKFIVQATYKGIIREAEFTVTVVNPTGTIVYEVENNILSRAIIGKDYNANIALAVVYKEDVKPNEVLPEITYIIKPGSYLPEGLTMSLDGKITGAPTKQANQYEFIVVAQALGLTDTEVNFIITISHETTIEVDSKQLVNGTFAKPYYDEAAIPENASGYEKTYKLKDGESLPLGLKLTNSGTIIGTPVETVTGYEFIIVISIPYSESVEVKHTITIGVGYDAFKLKEGSINEEYEDSVDYALSSGDITYKVKDSSKLPEGISLASDGTLKGTVTKAGTYRFTVIAESEGYLSAEIDVQLDIAGSGSGASTGLIIIVASSAVVLLGGAFIIIRKIKK